MSAESFTKPSSTMRDDTEKVSDGAFRTWSVCWQLLTWKGPKRGTGTFSQTAVAELTGKSVSTAGRDLRMLEAAGYVTKKHNRRGADTYRFHEEPVPLDQRTGSRAKEIREARQRVRNVDLSSVIFDVPCDTQNVRNAHPSSVISATQGLSNLTYQYLEVLTEDERTMVETVTTARGGDAEAVDNSLLLGRTDHNDKSHAEPLSRHTSPVQAQPASTRPDPPPQPRREQLSVAELERRTVAAQAAIDTARRRNDEPAIAVHSRVLTKVTLALAEAKTKCAEKSRVPA